LPGLADVFRVVTFGGVVNPDHLPLDQLMQLNLPDPLVPMLRRGHLILVSSSSLLAPIGVDFDAVEGAAVANVVVATFTDQGSDHWTACYQATLPWRDVGA